MIVVLTSNRVLYGFIAASSWELSRTTVTELVSPNSWNFSPPTLTQNKPLCLNTSREWRKNKNIFTLLPVQTELRWEHTWLFDELFDERFKLQLTFDTSCTWSRSSTIHVALGPSHQRYMLHLVPLINDTCCTWSRSSTIHVALGPAHQRYMLHLVPLISIVHNEEGQRLNLLYLKQSSWPKDYPVKHCWNQSGCCNCSYSSVWLTVPDWWLILPCFQFSTAYVCIYNSNTVLSCLNCSALGGDFLETSIKFALAWLKACF